MTSITLVTSKCHFMRLPREIRDEIYYLTFLGQSPPDRGTSFIEPRISSPTAHIVTRSNSSSFWGREPMTRLPRVSRTFQDETEAILYSRFTLSWPDYTSKELVQRVLRGLRPEARNATRSVQLHMRLHIPRGHSSESLYDDASSIQWKHACEQLGRRLPGLKRVQVVMDFAISPHPDMNERGKALHTVDLALDIFQDIPLDVLKVEAATFWYTHDPRGGDMVKEMNRRIQSGMW